MEDCPICYEKIADINVCITVCKHKFHTNCLIRCGSICPICRTNISSVTSNSPISKIPPGTYNVNEYIQMLNENNISIDDISPTLKEWIEDCKEHDKIIKEIEERIERREEERRNNLKKTDNNKYNLFYVKK